MSYKCAALAPPSQIVRRCFFGCRLLALDDDALSHITYHVAGGDDQHDLTQWKDACMMAMTCKSMIPIVKQSSCFNNVEYIGELVGPDVASGRDVSKESKILIDRNGTFEPKVRVLFQYGHDHEDGYTYKMQWSVPLLLSDLINKFYKPPWVEGGGRNRALE